MQQLSHFNISFLYLLSEQWRTDMLVLSDVIHGQLIKTVAGVTIPKSSLGFSFVFTTFPFPNQTPMHTYIFSR